MTVNQITGDTATAGGNARSPVLQQRDMLGVAPGKLYLDGNWRDGVGERWPAIHPATNEDVTTIACATAEEVDAAVTAARRAFDDGPWPRLKAVERKRHLRRLCELVEARADELTRLQTLDNGVPLSFSAHSRLSGRFVAEIFDYYGGWIDKLGGETYPQYAQELDLQFISVREPVGVVAAIIPWNGPLMQFANKVAPALAAGCTVVAKPSEYASLAVLRLTELIHQADLPRGTFNLVTGPGQPTGEALIHHHGVDKISFTGSRSVGQGIVTASAQGIKRVTLELGGKSAGVVFPGADLTVAAESIMGVVALGLSGQVCTAQTRALVHRSVYDDFIDEARKVAGRARFGNPFDPTTNAAALISRMQLGRVLKYVEDGINDGAQLAFGGHRLGGDLARGNFMEPTLFREVDSRMTIAQEEIFGPVLVVMPFDTEDEAIRIANASEYGLSGGVYTKDIARALRVGQAMRTGSVGINGYTFAPNCPIGGYKTSGLGREGSRTCLEEYTELKTIILNLKG